MGTQKRNRTSTITATHDPRAGGFKYRVYDTREQDRQAVIQRYQEMLERKRQQQQQQQEQDDG